jgi:hypothetical protein
VIEDTVSAGYEVEIIDLDAIKEGDELLTDKAKRIIQRVGVPI